MAGRLYEYSGINPLTIDQVALTEHYDSTKENPYFKLIDLKYHAIFVDSTENVFHVKENCKEVDLTVYHPRSQWIHGRPNWVFKNNRTPYFITQTFDSYPVQIHAYLDNEKYSGFNPYEYAVPFDIIELVSKNDKKALSLKKGKYILIVINDTYKEQEIKIEVP